jgi:hypothetical protein
MKRRILSGAGLSLALLVSAAAAWAQGEAWIHVRVTENDEGGKKVSVNVPLSLAQVALEVAPRDVLEKGRLKLNQKDISVADIRRLWTELKASGDAEFVTVEEKDKTVRIARAGDSITINVRDQSEKNETVQIRMPLTVVDALLSGEGETMDVSAAIAQLKGQRGEIVTVEGSDSQVRIWIDESRS